MSYVVGDKVIHWPHGPGEIVRIEQRTIHEHLTDCYVVRTSDLTIWVPIDDDQQSSLRRPTPPEEFPHLAELLASPGAQLPEDRTARKEQLTARLRDGHVEAAFLLVRDLTHLKHSVKLNEGEKLILEKATNTVIAEWTCSLGVPHTQAYEAMRDLLGEK